jgi:hypothetical protein
MNLGLKIIPRNPEMLIKSRTILRKLRKIQETTRDDLGHDESK